MQEHKKQPAFEAAGEKREAGLRRELLRMLKENQKHWRIQILRCGPGSNVAARFICTLL